MHRLWPLLLLLLLQPRTAAAEVLSYGYMAYVETVASATPRVPASPRYPMHRADEVEPNSSVPCPGDRSDRVPPLASSRVGPRVRAPHPPLLARSSAALRVAACSPHCERLPYHATAPPPL